MDFKSLTDPVVYVGENEPKKSLFSKIKPPLTNFFKNKQALGGVTTVLLFFAIGVGVYLSQTKTQLIPQAAQASAEISIRPSTQTVSINQEFQSDVFLDTKDLTFTALQVKITFDPTKLQLLQVKPTNFAQSVLTKSQNTDNSVFIIILIDNPGKEGAGNIATLKFKTIAQSSSPTKIQFDSSETKGAALETNSINALASIISSDISIGTIQNILPSSSIGNVVSKGDGNRDGKVDLQDLSVLFSRWSPAVDITSGFEIDFDNNNRINSFDYLKLKELLLSLGVIKRL